MNYSELIASLEATAEKLTGRGVIVRIEEMPGFNCMVQKNTDGRAVLKLHPDTFEDVQDFTRTFTHECAHIVKHFHEIGRQDTGKPMSAAAARFHTERPRIAGLEHLRAIASRREEEAEALAANWRKAVDKHYISYLQACRDPIATVLTVLYHKT